MPFRISAERRGVDRDIRRLAIPTMAALAAEPLYALCDTAILGRVGTSELAGAAAAMRVLALGHALFIFLLFGTTAAVARARGAQRYAEAAKTGVTAIWLALALGVLAAIVIGAAAGPLLSLMGASGEVGESASTYLRVSLPGFPGFTITMAAVGYLRGVSDTRTPLWVSILGVTTNLVVEIWLVFGLDLGVTGSAASTVAAKWLTAGILVLVVWRRVRPFDTTLRPRWAEAGSLLVVGRDLIARTAALLSALTTATALATRLGPAAAAAHSIGFAVWQFAGYIADGLEAAAQTLVAQSLGRADPGAARMIGRRILMWCVIVGIVVGVPILAFATPLAELFSNDAAVISSAVPLIVMSGLIQPLNAVTFGLDGILVGAGDQRFLAIAMAGAALGFAVVATVGWLTIGGLASVWAALGMLMIVRCTAGLRRFSGSRWLSRS